VSKFVYSLSIILFGLSIGYGIQILVNREVIRLPLPIGDLRKLLQRAALLFLSPVARVGALWIVNINHVGLVALPFLCLFALFIGGVFALGAAKLMKLGPSETGSIFGCGSFSNIGSFGSLICFIFLGEPGFALVPIYLEEISYYTIGFPIAKYYGGGVETAGSTFDRMKTLSRDPFTLVALSSLLLGGLLHFSGLERPNLYESLNALLIPFSAFLMLSSIGMALRFKRVRDYKKECLSIAVIKFLLVPLLTSSAAYAIGFGDIDGGLPLKVVIILASMPVAAIALIPPSIYDLDLDLANSCWFVSTALLIIILPMLFVVTNWI